MAETIPPWKFAPDEVPWARWAQERIQYLERILSNQTRFTNNENAVTGGALKVLGGQITALQAVVAQLAEPAGFSATGGSTPPSTVPVDQAIAYATVPAGFSRALVSINVIGALNNTASSGFGTLRLQSRIDSELGGPGVVSVDAGRRVSLSYSHVTVLTGLSDGQVISVAAQLAYLGTSTAEFASVQGTATFMV